MKSAGVSSAGQNLSRPCVGVVYTINGDLRYLSHQDELRMLRRALVRAGWPLRYSQGFNPAPRVRVLLPRSVGMASDCQLATVELREPRPVAELEKTLSATLPAGCRLHRLFAPAQATAQPRRALYRIELEPQEVVAAARKLSTLAPQAQVRSSQPQAGVQRYLDEVVLEGRMLRIGFRYVEGRTARLAEVLTAFGLDPACCVSRVRRVEVAWNSLMAAARPGPCARGKEDAAAAKGTDFGNSKSPKTKEIC
jgi:radical SAM-linked protein